MSRSIALIRFKDSGNIYMGVYDGTVDILRNFIFPHEDCYDANEDCYKVFTYSDKIENDENSYTEQDLSYIDYNDECEIYSDYGGGFWWNGLGNEDKRLVRSEDCFICYIPHNEIERCDGCPKWAYEYMKNVLGYQI